MRVKTESGTEYEFRKVEEGHQVRRDSLAFGGMRRDREWLKIYHFEKPQVGRSMVFLLEGLGEGPFTERTTSPVVSIEGDAE